MKIELSVVPLTKVLGRLTAKVPTSDVHNQQLMGNCAPSAKKLCPDVSANRREILLAGAAVAAASTITADTAINPVKAESKPAPNGPLNVVYFLVDNLGYGELGCYGGGILRGADTKRIDAFATQGMKLLNFAPETQCTPSRSALMTGRYASDPVTTRSHCPAMRGPRRLGKDVRRHFIRPRLRDYLLWQMAYRRRHRPLANRSWF
jgi:hypothetical protein